MSAATTGATWGSPTVVPVFQGRPQTTNVLLSDRSLAYPNLADIAVNTAVADGSTGVRLHTEHPYATGFRVGAAGTTTDVDRDDAYHPWPRTAGGEHLLTIQTLTAYGALAPRSLRYRTC